MMIYRKLGKTGLEVSQLGFGAMHLPMKGEGKKAQVDRDLAIPLMHRAFELGVNYIDTATFYCNEDSQAAVGDALKGWRDKIILSTKNPYFGKDEKAWWTHLEQSLERLQVDYIDIYNHHGSGWGSFQEFVLPVMSKWMEKARDQKLIRHICTSFHDSPEALKKIVETGYPEAITVQYNMIDTNLAEGIALAHERGIGVVVMGPIAGGRLLEPSETLATMSRGTMPMAELGLRFVLDNPNVSTAISGIHKMNELEQNVRVASDGVSLDAADRRLIEEKLVHLKKYADLYCTGCSYCMPCPAGVDIPGVFTEYNKGRVFGFWKSARGGYAWMTGAEQPLTADHCTDCGACEEKCPQKIPIRKQLKEAHEALKKQ